MSQVQYCDTVTKYNIIHQLSQVKQRVVIPTLKRAPSLIAQNIKLNATRDLYERSNIKNEESQRREGVQIQNLCVSLNNGQYRNGLWNSLNNGQQRSNGLKNSFNTSYQVSSHGVDLQPTLKCWSIKQQMIGRRQEQSIFGLRSKKREDQYQIRQYYGGDLKQSVKEQAQQRFRMMLNQRWETDFNQESYSDAVRRMKEEYQHALSNIIHQSQLNMGRIQEMMEQYYEVRVGVQNQSVTRLMDLRYIEENVSYRRERIVTIDQIMQMLFRLECDGIGVMWRMRSSLMLQQSIERDLKQLFRERTDLDRQLTLGSFMGFVRHSIRVQHITCLCEATQNNIMEQMGEFKLDTQTIVQRGRQYHTVNNNLLSAETVRGISTTERENKNLQQEVVMNFVLCQLDKSIQQKSKQSKRILKNIPPPSYKNNYLAVDRVESNHELGNHFDLRFNYKGNQGEEQGVLHCQVGNNNIWSLLAVRQRLLQQHPDF